MAATSGPDAYGAFTSQGYDLLGDGSGSSGFNVTGDLVGGGANPAYPAQVLARKAHYL